MIADFGPILQWALTISYVLLALSMILAFIRLVLGPTLADRVVALDVLTLIAVAFNALLALSTGSSAYLDVSIALALVAFLATVAFARYAERRQAIDDKDREEDGR